MTPTHPDAQTLKPVLLAGFELLDKIGEGGMGAVYRARQVSLDRVARFKGVNS
jgi:serine/threonine protein kinase